MSRALSDYFRYPDGSGRLTIKGELSKRAGFFQFGEDVICYGRCAGISPTLNAKEAHTDVSHAIWFEKGEVLLPFAFESVINNLRYERYCEDSRISSDRAFSRNVTSQIYYALRPVLSVSLRKHLQRARLRGWKQIAFPRWPVDFTIDTMMARALGLVLKSHGMKRIPFIWFWPEGYPACAIMTHDVEGIIGRNFCGQLMDLDDSFGIKSAFQIVPEVRYEMRNGFLHALRNRGFEVNVHDLNHDGLLFRDKEEFSRRANEINRYARDFRAEGFRSGAMYRNQDWFDAFEFSYDMSVPSVAHLEPQRGGCCTVMPYSVGKVLELPLTTIQDYSLFHILGDYSIDLWKRQIELIMQRNGLISFITHPDYLFEKRAQAVYTDLLTHLTKLREEQSVWFALPRDVNRWWRDRQRSRLVQSDGQWRIEGPGSDRGRIAYATLEGDRLTYSFEADSNPACVTRTSPGFHSSRGV